MAVCGPEELASFGQTTGPPAKMSDEQHMKVQLRIAQLDEWIAEVRLVLQPGRALRASGGLRPVCLRARASGPQQRRRCVVALAPEDLFDACIAHLALL